jgi:hypothetical protein
MTFPSDIKNAMRECILRVLWPKKDIASFFQSNGCTSLDMKCLGDINTSSRANLIDTMFQHLSSRPDGGRGPFRAMLQALVNWSHFDSYYFEKLRKLDRNDAQRSIDHLRQLQEIRDSKINSIREERLRKEKAAQKANASLDSLHDTFLSLLQGRKSAQGKYISPQERGYALEALLQELARLSNLEVTEQFWVLGEQIDGAIKFEGEHYIFEAKWQDAAASNEPVYQFAAKVEGKLYGRGLFISVNGYSPLVVDSLTKGKAIRTILIDGADILMVLLNFS